MIDIVPVDYRPDHDLDAELAELAYLSTEGWPDQRPLNSAFVRSMLRPAGMTATTLFLHRDEAGRLVGAGALRWPSTLDASGRVWGPMVRPDAAGRGVGSSLLAAMAEAVATRRDTRMITSEIPGSRKSGWSLYESAGWQVNRMSQLLTRAVPETVESVEGQEPTRTSSGAVLRPARKGEYLHQVLGELFAAIHPQLGYATARDVFTHWSSDARYRPDGLLLAEGADRLQGVILVYPLSNEALPDPAEALIAHVLISPKLDPAEAMVVQDALVAGALRVSAALGAKIVRTVTHCPMAIESLLRAGFEIIDDVRYYSATRPA